MTFAVIFVSMAKILLPRIDKALAERHEAIEGQRDQAERMTREAHEVLAQYREELAEARHEAARVRQEAFEQGTLLIAGLRAEAQRERETMIAQSQARLAADRVVAAAELRESVVVLATELGGRMLGEPIDGVARDSDVVHRFFADLDTHSSAGSQ
ncbi:F0F1 ATP synthase subunit B [Streptomyces sp. MMG1121]|uniref:F0F1 ATP synthase subunit B family protein n=1 Tax=Streptomyces sp. MMG1121 TaxID=1415544 RepID=UPI001F1ED2DE|nr:F0F1 ATP synthase subunit B [Streptomyces sp. MMG1121]